MVVVTAAAVAVDTGEAVEAAATEVEVEVMEAAETTATDSAMTDTKTIRYPFMSPKLSQLHKPPSTSNSLHHIPRFLLLPNLVIN